MANHAICALEYLDNQTISVQDYTPRPGVSHDTSGEYAFRGGGQENLALFMVGYSAN